MSKSIGWKTAIAAATAFSAMAIANPAMATTTQTTTTGTGTMLASAANNSCKGAPKAGQQRCFGIVKAGENGCRTATHACGGLAKTNGNPQDWIDVPTGLCNKLVDASTTSPQGNGTEQSS